MGRIIGERVQHRKVLFDEFYFSYIFHLTKTTFRKLKIIYVENKIYS